MAYVTRVLQCEPWWNSNNEGQAVCKCWRIGQEGQVYYYIFMGKRALMDHHMAKVAYKKSRIVTKLLKPLIKNIDEPPAYIMPLFPPRPTLQLDKLADVLKEMGIDPESVPDFGSLGVEREEDLADYTQEQQEEDKRRQTYDYVDADEPELEEEKGDGDYVESSFEEESDDSFDEELDEEDEDLDGTPSKKRKVSKPRGGKATRGKASRGKANRRKR